MPRYKSDESDDGRESSRKHKKKSKKRKGRSRSGSDSGESYASSSRVKKSKRKHARTPRSRSPDREQGRSSRRSRSQSPSYDRYKSSSRRSKRSYSRSRSPTPRKGRRSRSGSRSRRQRRSRSYSRENRSRSDSRNRFSRLSPEPKSDTSSALKKMSLTESSTMTPAEQAEERMRLALKAAAAADERLRGLPSGDLGVTSSSLHEGNQPRFSSYEESKSFTDSVAAIDSGNFKQKAFKSSATNNSGGGSKKNKQAQMDLGPTHDDAIFGSLAVSGFTIKPDPDTKPIDLNPESIIHPNLFIDREAKLDRWIVRLQELRHKILEGDAL